MPALSKEDKLRLLTIILESQHGDLREQNLNRQGKGHFHVSGMGHEGLAALGVAMVDGDYVVPYYRDRALVLGRGVASRELALDYFAKRKGQSHGRQMPSHYSYASRGIWSVTLAFPLREIIQGQLARGDSAAKNERAVAIIGNDIIAVDHRHTERRETFVAHAGNMKMALSLPIQILFAQITVPALEDDREQTQFIFFGERGHSGTGDDLSKRTNTQVVVATCRRVLL